MTNPKLGDVYRFIEDNKPGLTRTERDFFVLAKSKNLGVNELFSSNPELANQVYEALGFKSIIDNKFSLVKNDNLYKDQLEPGINTYEIHYDDRIIGKIAVFDTGKNITIKGLNFNESERNKGLGKAFYKWLNNEANKKGGVLWGDPEQISPDADRVWNSLNKEGLVDITKTTPRFLESQITPQQEQEAKKLYSQYLDSLNKPNTNPVLLSNQQEQVKKFAELQERLNNKEFLKGAKNAYESTPALQELGTQEEYNDYIARVSLGIIKNPSSGEYNYTSKVKDIVYHGTDKEFDTFKKPSDVGSQNKMIAFADDIEYAKIAGSRRTPLKKIISVLVNIKKLYPVDKLEAMELDSGYRDEVLKELKKEGVDGFAFESDDDLSTKKFNEVLVFEPEQIHILGSKQDIEGFKKFVIY